MNLTQMPLRVTTGAFILNSGVGKLKVDEFITHRQPLSGINEAFHDMHSGECIRCVVDMRKL